MVRGKTVGLMMIALCVACGWATANPARIAVSDDETYVRVLESFGYDVALISAEDFTDPAALSGYRVVCHPGSRLTAAQIDGLRAFVREGGSLYAGRIFSDLAGARYGNGGYGVGWVQEYRTLVAHPVTEGLPVGEWVAVPDALNVSYVRGVSALIPTTGLPLMEIRAQPAQKAANPQHDFAYEFTGKQQAWGWMTAQGYGEGKVLCLPHYNLPRVIEFLGDREEGAPYRRLFRNAFDWLISDDREGLPVTETVAPRPLRDWPGLANVEIPDTRDRTIAFIGEAEFLASSPETIIERCQQFNVGILFFFSGKNLLDNPGTVDATIKPEIIERMDALRAGGLKLGVAFGRTTPAEVAVWCQDATGKISNRWPSWLDKDFRAYCLHLSRLWAPHADYIGPDEWGFTPKSWSFDELSVAAFKQQYAHTDAHIETIKADTRAPTKLCEDWWHFMVDVQDDLLIAMADASKEANPRVKTAISYITHERNWSGKGARRAPGHYDCLYDCQFYWYGRWADRPMNAALATKAIGWAKNLREEYPDKEIWAGWAPGYTGGRGDKPTQWWNHVSHYGNTPEEFFPYLASLYAAADRVFVFVIFNGQGPGAGSDLDFRAVSQLASKAVPTVRNFKPGKVAYYWNPEQSRNVWRTVGRPWAAQEGPVVPLGVLSEFADIDITGDLSDYENVVVCGYHRPPDESVGYDRRRVLAWFAPEHDGAGGIADPLAAGAYSGLGVLPVGEYRIEGDVTTGPHLLYSARLIEDAAKPLRWVEVEGERRVICARSEDGRLLLDTTNPWYLRQDAARQLIKCDLEHFGWATRDCPQFVGTDRVVAFSLIDPRTAVVELPRPEGGRVRLVVMDAEAGVRSDELMAWRARIEVALPPHSVLIATLP